MARVAQFFGSEDRKKDAKRRVCFTRADGERVCFEAKRKRKGKKKG